MIWWVIFGVGAAAMVGLWIFLIATAGDDDEGGAD